MHFFDTPEGRITLDVHQQGIFMKRDENGCEEKEVHENATVKDTDTFRRFILAYPWTTLIIQTSETAKEGDLFLYINIKDESYGPAFKLYSCNHADYNIEKRYSMETVYGTLYFKVYSTGIFKEIGYVDDNKVAKIVKPSDFNHFLKDYLWRAVSIEKYGDNLFLVIDLMDEYYGRPAFRLYPCEIMKQQ